MIQTGQSASISAVRRLADNHQEGREVIYMNVVKAAAVVLGAALLWNIPTFGAKSKSLPRSFPFGTQRPTSMTYLIFIDGQAYEDYTVTFQYGSDGRLLLGEYDYGPNSGMLDYLYEDGKLVAREDVLLDHTVYFLYDENGMIYAADHEMNSANGRDPGEKHDITYHYDPAGRLSYSEAEIEHVNAKSGETEKTSVYVRFNYSFYEYVQWEERGASGGRS